MGFIVAIARPSESGPVVLELPEVETMEEAVAGCTNPETLVSSKVLKRGYTLFARDEQGVIVCLRTITKAKQLTTVEVTEKNISLPESLKTLIKGSGFSSMILDVNAPLARRSNWWSKCESSWAMLSMADMVGVPWRMSWTAGHRLLRTTLKLLDRATPDPTTILEVMGRYIAGEATRTAMLMAADDAKQLRANALSEYARAKVNVNVSNSDLVASLAESGRAMAAQAIQIATEELLGGIRPLQMIHGVTDALAVNGEYRGQTHWSARIAAKKVGTSIVRQTITTRDVLYAIQVQAWKSPA